VSNYLEIHGASDDLVVFAGAFRDEFNAKGEQVSFTPELGQLGFSNTPWQEHEVSELAVAALRAIGDEMERVMWNRTQEVYNAPTGNVGGEPFVTSAFTMRAYCWCDGGGHPEGCPPNFEWRDLRICWYKHLGRGTSANADLTPDMIAEMLTDCLASVRGLDVDCS
jgi:hypothetical protein